MSENSDKVLKIDLLGHFSISYDGKEYLQDAGSSKKVINLLQYLIVHRNSNISYDQIIYAMKLDEGNKNPISVLKNLIYRVRTLLKDSGLPEADYIIQSAGTYQWNSEISCEVDTEIFEENIRKSEQKELSEDEQAYWLEQAIFSYKGDFLLKNSVELWIVPLQTYYEGLFEKSVRRYYYIAQKKEDFVSMEKICCKAVQIDQFSEDFYIMLIECFCRLKKYKEALEAYEKIADFLYDQLGVSPSERLLELYKEIMGELNYVEQNLMLIDQDLREDEENIISAFYCNYGVFKTITQFSMRMFERTGQSLCILLFTVTDSRGNMPQSKRRHDVMDDLKETIGKSLRRGDLFSRYSATQYIIMLSGANYENGGMVGQRILDRYHESHFSKTIKISYKVKMMNISNI